MNQGIYKIIDEIIKNFVSNNREDLRKMIGPTIIPIDHFKDCISIKKWPFFIRFIGRFRGAEGVVFSFIDDNMDKVYSYYDVEERSTEC